MDASREIEETDSAVGETGGEVVFGESEAAADETVG